MQVKISIVPDTNPPPVESEPRVGVTPILENGIAGPMDVVSSAEGETTVSVPSNGKVMVTIELPPIEYDAEQKAATRGKWPSEPVAPLQPVAPPSGGAEHVTKSPSSSSHKEGEKHPPETSSHSPSQGHQTVKK